MLTLLPTTGSLNVASTGAATEASVAPLAGTRLVIVGGVVSTRLVSKTTSTK
jgi:hypothetical protein